jgi:hypothetical protein
MHVRPTSSTPSRSIEVPERSLCQTDLRAAEDAPAVLAPERHRRVRRRADRAPLRVLARAGRRTGGQSSRSRTNRQPRAPRHPCGFGGDCRDASVDFERHPGEQTSPARPGGHKPPRPAESPCARSPFIERLDEITAIIVAYNSALCVAAFLASIHAHIASVRADELVVEAESRDPTTEIVAGVPRSRLSTSPTLLCTA